MAPTYELLYLILSFLYGAGIFPLQLLITPDMQKLILSQPSPNLRHPQISLPLISPGTIQLAKNGPEIIQFKVFIYVLRKCLVLI
jgi:hypothetical protein